MPEIPQDIYEKMNQPGATTTVDTTQQPPAEPQPDIVPVRQQQDQPRRSDQPATQPQQQQAPVFDENKWLEEKFQGKFKTFDDLTAELSKPPQVVKETEPLTFANDEAKTFYELVSQGKIDETLPILQKRAFAKQSSTMDADALLIEYLKEENGLTNEQARRQLERQYSFDDTGLSDADIEIERTMLNTKKTKDAEKARQYFATNIPELKLPAATQPVQQPVYDEKAKAALSFGAQFAEDKISSIPFEFAPLESSLKVQGQIALPTDDVQKLSDQITDPLNFLAGLMAARWYKDGQPDKTAIARDVLFLSDPQKYFNKVAEQTTNQVLKQKLARDKNINPESGGGQSYDMTGNQDDVMDKFFHIPAAKNGQHA